MPNNFRHLYDQIECDPLIKECLKQLYEAEETGMKDPAKKPNITFYQNIINELYGDFKHDNNEDDGEE